MNRKNYIINQDVKEKLEIDKNNSDNYGGFHFILYDRNGKRTAGFPSDEVPDLFAEVKWNQEGQRRSYFLSDLHNRMYGKENERLLESIKNQHPDLILIGGDMLVRKDGNSYDRTVRFLEKLPAICPVYCANGNHEQKLKELPDKYEQSYEGVQESTDGMRNPHA